MNKFLELEKRFEKIMRGIEKLPFKQSNGTNTREKTDIISDHSLSKDETNRLSNRILELEKEAKKDSEQLDLLIIELQSLLENKDD